MKETIEYYYAFKIDTLFIENNAYYFIDNKEYYYFVHFFRTEKDLQDILMCIDELKYKKIHTHELILNNQGRVITKIDDQNYVLMKINDKNREFSIIDMIQMNRKLNLSFDKINLYRNNWANLWSIKVDYIESQMNELKIPKSVIKTINYYIGLAENAIYYVNNTNKKYQISEKDRIVLSHKRIYYPNYGLNYLNPLSFIFDLEVRDIAEYLKSVFFKGEDALLELKTYLNSSKLSNYSYNMLFARLLYPSYYFDLYEKIINNNDDSDKIIKIISKADEYALFLKKAYKLIALYAPLEDISYLIYPR